MDDLPAANPQNQAHAKRGRETHGGRVQSPNPHYAKGCPAQAVGAVGEAAVLVGFLAERFDLADALEIVHQQGVHGAGGLALRAVATMSSQRVP